MLLSRVAESLYWINRYLERAENISRFVEVSEAMSLDCPPGSAEPWLPLIDASSDRESFDKRFPEKQPDDVINSVPQSLREGSYAIGATKSETIKKVVIPAALPGIIGSILLAVSRAIGETMIVVMAAGLAANLTINPLESTTTITTQIVMILVGDQEFDSPKTQAAFALGLTLFIATLILNYIALRVVKKYREKYD